MKVHTYAFLFHIYPWLYQHIVNLLFYLHSFFSSSKNIILSRKSSEYFQMSISNKYTRKPKVPLIRDSSLRVSSNKFFFLALMLLLLRTSYTTHCWMLLVHWHTFTSIYFSPKQHQCFSLYGQSFFLTFYLKTRQLQQQISMNFIQGHEAAIFIFISWYFHSFPLEIFLKFSTHSRKVFLSKNWSFFEWI